MMNGFGWGGWLVGVALMVGFWVLIFWVVVSLVRRPESQSTRSTAHEILSERFARGDIDADEYARRHDALVRGEGTRA